MTPEQAEALETLRVSRAAINQACRLAKTSGRSAYRILNETGALTDEALADFMAEASGFERLNDLPELESAIETVFLPGFMKARRLLPLPRKDNGRVDVGLVDALDQIALDGAHFTLGETLGDFFVIRAADWQAAYRQYCEPLESERGGLQTPQSDTLLGLGDADRDSPIVRRVAELITDAVDRGASDIHFEAGRHGLAIRYRIDGVLEEIASEPAYAADGLLARIKVLAGLDLGQRRQPQDGRTSIVVRGRQVDVRVSILPGAEGECAVLRLLDRPDTLLTLEALGFGVQEAGAFDALMKRRDGLVLVAGPTGSGKTTTLYACLQLLQGQGLKIVSAEDPIEYRFDHVTQVQINEAAGLGFAEALRAFLRHDPDIILVGEIRDPETARIAVQAALTGHLVLASIHAVDTDRIKARLTDMGVDGFQLDAALAASVSQRLVRRLCSSCRRARRPTDSERQLYLKAGLECPETLYDAPGCSACQGTGYAGRLAIAEGLEPDGGSLLINGLTKARDGFTAPADVSLAV